MDPDKSDATPLDPAEIRRRIKEIIASVTGLDALEIADEASFVEDLELDSLSLLEVGVDVDYEFKLGVPEERLQELRTVEDTVRLVMTAKSSGAGAEEAA